MKNEFYCALIVLTILMLITQSCVEEYEHSGIKEISGLLVIDGIIQSDTTVVKLSTSIGTNQYSWAIQVIPDAQVYVERDDGVIYGPGMYIGEGTYEVLNEKLREERQYRLFAMVNEKEYASEFLTPLKTPEIDNLSYDKKGIGMPVSFYVSAYDSDEKSPYYRWKYKEHWEVNAELFANAGYESVDGAVTLVLYDLSRNIYHCWGKDSSKSLVLGYTSNLSENRIRNQKLLEIDPSDEKLSILYYIQVEQMKLREEAFSYFSQMQKNIDQTGGLFSSMPSSVRGNIKCLSDPETEVIGYIEVTEITNKSIYIPASANLYEPSFNRYCMDNIKYDPTYNYPIYLYGDGTPLSYAPASCIDCRTKPNASKEKPSFWPTDSQ